MPCSTLVFTTSSGSTLLVFCGLWWHLYKCGIFPGPCESASPQELIAQDDHSRAEDTEPTFSLLIAVGRPALALETLVYKMHSLDGLTPGERASLSSSASH